MIKANTPLVLSLLISTVAFAQPQPKADLDHSQAAKTAETVPTEQNIPAESLFQLLAAELALDRIEPEVALANYIAAAKQTQDKSVAKRATEIALTVASLEVAVEPATLWATLAQNDLEAQITIAAIYLRLLQSDKALPFLVQLAKINPELANQHFLLLYQQLPEKTEKQALVKSLEQISQQYPKEAFGAEPALAEILLSQRAAEQALPYSQLAIKKQPASIESIRIYSLNLAHLGKVNEGKQFIEQKLKTHGSLNLKKYFLDFLVAHQIVGESKAVLQDIRTNHSLTPEEQLELAKFSMQHQMYDEAQALLTSLKEVSEQKDQAHYFLARLSETKNKSDEAIEWYKQVLTGPYHVLSQIRASMLLTEKKSFEEALVVLHRTQPQSDDDVKRILMSEIDILITVKKHGQALQKLNTAISDQPDDLDLRYARSLVATNLKEIKIAEDDLKWIIGQQETHVDALNALGYLLTNHTKRYQEAYTYLDKALKLSPNNPVVLDSMGWLQYKMGNLEKSAEILRKAISIVADPEIAAHLGEVLWHLKDYKNARQVWDQGLALNPNNENILEAMQRLLQQ